MMIRSLLAALLAAMPLGAVAAPPQRGATPQLYLLGTDWFGRWQDGRIVAHVDRPGRNLEALVADNRANIWTLSFSRQADGDGDLRRYASGDLTENDAAIRTTLLRTVRGVGELWPSRGGAFFLVRFGTPGSRATMFDPRTQNAVGEQRSIADDFAGRQQMLAGRWLVPVPQLVGIDTDPVIPPSAILDVDTLRPVAPAWLADPGHSLLAIAGNTALVMVAPRQVATIAIDSGHVLATRAVAAEAPDGLRAALSPDGGTAALFVRGGNEERWSGAAWNVATGRVLPLAAFFIDKGQTRENGARRNLACLLPNGAGAIFSLLGAPADRQSETVLVTGKASSLADFPSGRFVDRCVMGSQR